MEGCLDWTSFCNGGVEGLLAQNKVLFVQNKGLLLQHPGLFAEHEGLLAQNKGLLAQNKRLLAYDKGLLAQKDSHRFAGGRRLFSARSARKHWGFECFLPGLIKG